MAEFIDRQAAIDALTERNLVVHMDSVNDGLVASCHRSAQRIIANIPAADVRPVRVGKLEKYGAAIRCSVCGFDTQSWDVNFCPNCGADMREKS